MADFAENLLPTLSTTGPWEWCFRENATYLDCPVAEHPDSTSFIVAAFNPAAVPSDYSTLLLKHAHYDVSVYDPVAKQFVALKKSQGAAAVCEADTLSNGVSVTSCRLFVDYAIDGMQVGLI